MKIDEIELSEELNELSKIDNNNKIFLSSTKISVFLDCISKFKFRYIDLIDVPIKIYWYGIFGIVLHKILEKLISEIFKNKKDFEDLFLEYKNKNFFEIFFEEELSKIKNLNKKIILRKPFNKSPSEFFSEGFKNQKKILNFLKLYFIKKYLNLETEKSFFYPWIPFLEENINFFSEKNNFFLKSQEIKIKGIIDILAFKEDDQINIYDLKVTGDSSKFYFIDWENDIQSNIYFYLTLINYKKVPKSFNYLVLDREKNILFLKSEYFNNKNFKIKKNYFFLKNFLNKYNYFLENQKKDLDEFYSPEQKKCFFCEFNKICRKSFYSLK